MINRPIPAIATLTFLQLCAACTPEKADPPQAVGMANPASVYCVEQGGTLEIRSSTEGDAGYCTLPEGRVVEEWAYFKEAHP